MLATSWWIFGLDILWKSTVVLGSAGVAVVSLRRASAAMRHLIWVAALGALLLLPALEMAVPVWHTAGWSGPSPSITHPADRQTIRVSPSSASGAPVRDPGGFLPIVFAIWVSGFLACLLRWRRASAQATGLRSQAEEAGAGLEEQLRELDPSGEVSLLCVRRDIVPMTAGMRRPAIILPARAAVWPPERLRLVLLRELAHVRRNDCLTQALAEWVSCLYWFHPLAWLAVSSLRVEREKACDDLVLSAGHKASDYAAHLLDLARSLDGRELAPSAVAMVAPSNLEARMRAILNPGLQRRRVTPVASIAAALMAACLVLPLAAMRPQAGDARTVSGTVYDAEGAVVPDAVVTLTNSDNETKQKTTTDPVGRFSVGPLDNGGYRLEVDARGFAPATRWLKVDGQRQLHFNLTMDLGTVEESISVQGKGSPAPPPVGPHRVRVGGNVTAPKLIFQAKPEYPDDARSRGVEGDVVLRAVISVDGIILGSLAPVSSPDAQLTKAAMDAVRQWRYEPALLNGKPVETVTTITVNFQLAP